MSTSTPQPTYQWRVTSITPDTDISVGGAPIPGVRITFQVVDPPVAGSVFAPDPRKGDVAYVKSLIDAEAAQLSAIATLTSG